MQVWAIWGTQNLMEDSKLQVNILSLYQFSKEARGTVSIMGGSHGLEFP